MCAELCPAWLVRVIVECGYHHYYTCSCFFFLLSFFDYLDSRCDVDCEGLGYLINCILSCYTIYFSFKIFSFFSDGMFRCAFYDCRL